MPTKEQETIREFIFAGNFSTDTLIAAGIGLALLVTFLAWWECRRANRRLFPVFVLLRLGAVVVALWMLAEPTIQTRVRQAVPKSLAILVDTSASMGVVDSAEDRTMAVRWAAANNPSSRSRLVVDADGAATTVESARRHMMRFVTAWQSGGSAEEMEQTVLQAEKSAEAAVRQLKAIAPEIAVQQANPSVELNDIRSSLDHVVVPELAALHKEIRSERLLLTEDRIGKINTAIKALADHSGRLHTLADELASECAEDPDLATLNMIRTQSTMSRVEKVVGLLEEAQRWWLKDLEDDVGLIRYCFHSEVYPIADQKWGALLSADRFGEGLSTDLAAAIGQVALDQAGQSIEAAILLTDGGHNAARDAVSVASTMSHLPMYVVPIGNTQPLRDVILHHVQSPRAVFRNDLIVIESIVDAHGCAGEELVIELSRDNEVVDSVEILVPSDTFGRQLTFTQKAEELGAQTFRLRVRELPEERVKDNNQAELSVEVIEDEIRVLLVDYMPRWEYRYLRNLFRREERIDFDEVLFEPRTSNLATPARGEGLPQDIDGWGRYRVIILGDVPPAELGELQLDYLEQYVEKRGGTLILIAGEEFMPGAYARHTMARMIPVQLTPGPLVDDTRGFNLFVTPEGRAVPATQLGNDQLDSDRVWSELLPIYGLSRYSQAKPTAHVLIGAAPRSRRGQELGSEQAFLCWQYYGKGRVVYLSGPVTYRFRFRKGDLYHHRFWGQLLRWAVAREMAGGSKTVKVSTDKTRYTQGDQVQISVWLHEADGGPASGASCRALARQEGSLVAQVDLAEEEENPGVYHGILKDLPVGSIVIGAAGPDIQRLLEEEGYSDPVETEITVDPPDSLELRNTRCNLPLLSQIAESTGGMIIPPTSLEAAVRQLDFTPEVSENVTQEPLWTRWTLLWIFLGCLAAEWVVRKLAGMA